MKALQKQRQLYFLGYYGAGPEELDGIWGLKSRAATLEYQHDAGLEADGIFGAHTAARTKEVSFRENTFKNSYRPRFRGDVLSSCGAYPLFL